MSLPGSDRLPPHNTDAEQALIGALFLDIGILPNVKKLISAEDFYLQSHTRIFSAIDALHEQGNGSTTIDLLTVRDALEKAGTLTEIGGPAFLATLVDKVPTAANFSYHAKLIREEAKKRRLLFECYNTIDALFDERKPFAETFQTMNEHVHALDFDPIQWARTRNGQPIGIHEAEYVNMLESYGFRVAKYNGKLDFVHTTERIVESLEWFKNACVTVKHTLRERFEHDFPALWELLLKAHKFDYKTLTSLSAIEQHEFLDHDADACRLAFENGILTITRSSISFASHENSEAYMWKRQICPRPYEGIHNTHGCCLDFKNADADEINRRSEIERFIFRASSQESDEDGFIDNREIFEYAIGFAAWHYNDVANPKAVVIIDCDPSHFSDGRRGKGIILQMLRALVGDGTPDGPVTNLNGKSLSGQFKFQRVTPQTMIMMIDDVDPTLVSFEQFYSDITEGLISEGKGLQQFAFTPETTPKMIFTSNKPFFGIERSTSDRMLLLPMTDFFAQEGQKPMQYFGHRLFKDWDSQEWARFYDYMALLVQMAMRRDPMNLPVTDLSVFNANRIYLDLDETFVRFMDELDDDTTKEKDEIISALESNKVTFKRGQFKKALETYARLRGRTLFYNTKDRRYKIKNQEYIRFTSQKDMHEGLNERIHEAVTQTIAHNKEVRSDDDPF